MNSFTKEEIETANQVRIEVLQGQIPELKGTYMAGEICMHEELRHRIEALTKENDRLKLELLQRDVSWLPAKDSEIEALTIKCTELENELADMTEQKDYHYNAWYQLKKQTQINKAEGRI